MSDDFGFVAPDLTAETGEKITYLEGAYVVPPPDEGVNRSVQNSGVLDAEGRHVENSITWRGVNPVTRAPAMPAPETVADLPGTWMFLGPLFGHFGHFLVESICRFWAYEQLETKIDGVLYVPKFQNRPEHVASVYQPFLKMLGVAKPMLNLAVPTRVERLYVPRQGFGMFQMIEGSAEFRDYARRNCGTNVEARGAKKIYVSRSALPAIRGSLIGEKVLEQHLEAEGYEVFHPQKHNHEQQIAAYKAATHIIAVDCSPLHLLALVGNKDQKVGVIARRSGDLDQIFVRQIKAFQGADAHAINVLQRNWIEDHANRPSRTSWGEVDMAALYDRLFKAGLITGKTPWPSMTEAEIGAEVEKIGAEVGTRFKPFEGQIVTAVSIDN